MEEEGRRPGKGVTSRVCTAMVIIWDIGIFLFVMDPHCFGTPIESWFSF